MKKETSIAVIFGIILGVIVAFFVIFQNKENRMNKNKPLNISSKITPTTKPSNLATIVPLQLTEPSDNAITNKNNIKIKGKVNKDSLIIFQSPIKDLIVKNDKEDFSIDFPLALGENVIRITVYPKDKTLSSFQKELKVFYLDEQ
jgi:hypothetical protein